MQLKTLQWNIGGGFVREESADPKSAASYNRYDLEQVIALIEREQPDIITLQESHATEDEIQAEAIAKRLGYFWINDPYDDSHIDPSAKLCQSIISRYPIRGHRFELFLNPHWKRVEGDKSWESHDKGMTTASADLGAGKSLTIQTLHAIPFNNWFSFDPRSAEAKPVLESMRDLMQPNDGPYVLQGDFNIDGGNLEDFFPDFATLGIKELENAAPTNPKGRKLDRVLYKSLQPVSIHSIQDVLTDHYPVVAIFEY